MEQIRKVSETKYNPGLQLASGGWDDKDVMQSSTAVMNQEAA